MRFLLDAQLSPGLVSGLVNLGREAEHVAELGMTRAGDSEIWRHAVAVGAVIVTKDSDFAQRRRSVASGPPIVWLRIGNTTTRALTERFLPVVPDVVAALETGETLIEVR